MKSSLTHIVRPLSKILTLTLALTLLFAATGCEVTQEAHSELFTKIFKDGEGTFRGIDLGWKLMDVQNTEGRAPKHDDKWGYVYEFNLGEDRRFMLEYICKNDDKRLLRSIVANIFLRDEAEATELYNEMEAHLRSKYGVADGTFGLMKWNYEEENLYASLRMLDDKKSISLNFVPIGGF